MRGKSGEMERGVPRRRRPRPVVTEGVEALLLRGDELAKGWLLALVEDAPLESAAAIMAGDVARDGPRIELARTDPDLLADAGERLSLVAGLVRAAVLRRHAESEPGGASRPRVPTLRVEIVRAARARLPLSLLLVELEEAERLLTAGPRGEASATFGRFAQAVRTALRHRDVLACETESRAWIIARDTGRAGAQALGSRIVSAVPSEESWLGGPLTVSVGLAVLREDGHNAAALIDAAEQMRFAAEASGIGIVTDEPGEGGTEPTTPGPTLVS